MRKNLIITLLLILSATLLTAADPSPATFSVSTKISAVNDMKITNTQVDEDTYSEPDNTFSGTVSIVGSGPDQNMDANGNVDFTAYVSAISNNRVGYTVLMSATPLISEGEPPAIINYTVTVNEVPYDTTGTPAAVSVITVESLDELSVESLPISVRVDRDQFDSAVAGTYTGSVTFEYTAAN